MLEPFGIKAESLLVPIKHCDLVPLCPKFRTDNIGEDRLRLEYPNRIYFFLNCNPHCLPSYVENYSRYTTTLLLTIDNLIYPKIPDQSFIYQNIDRTTVLLPSNNKKYLFWLFNIKQRVAWGIVNPGKYSINLPETNWNKTIIFLNDRKTKKQKFLFYDRIDNLLIESNDLYLEKVVRTIRPKILIECF